MFAASFDSKMGCLYSVFDAKKQGKPAWVVRTRNWKLRGGENLLARVSIPPCVSTRVVYRSWIFGFDSGIPRVTISGRFCDWTGSRGLHLLVSEPGYAIIGTVSEAPIAYTTIENVVLVKQLEQLDPCPC
ncbi:hypothetical protein GQ457_04G023180 [Hibiscus cannabinus]